MVEFCGYSKWAWVLPMVLYTNGVTVDHVDGAYFRFNGDGGTHFMSVLHLITPLEPLSPQPLCPWWQIKSKDLKLYK